MTVAPKREVPKELIDGLLADYKKPEDLIGLLPVVFPYIKALGVRNFLLFCSIEQREVLHEEGTIY